MCVAVRMNVNWRTHECRGGASYRLNALLAPVTAQPILGMTRVSTPPRRVFIIHSAWKGNNMKVDFNQLANEAGKWLFAGFVVAFGYTFGMYIIGKIPWPMS